jgi:hypothetical protein
MPEKKEIVLPDELGELLRKNNARINSIGKYQIQAWVDWLIMHTQRGLKKADIIQAIENYELNWTW